MTIDDNAMVFCGESRPRLNDPATTDGHASFPNPDHDVPFAWEAFPVSEMDGPTFSSD
jgi:hypothetical protein